MNPDEKNINDIVNFYKNDKLLKFELEGFKKQVENFFLDWPGFVINDKSVIHSIKSRIKDAEHLRDKLQRKIESGRKITVDNFRNEVTDLIGVRILYLINLRQYIMR
ncbi:hypothetical protein ACEXAJ_06090 [Fusobacterium necrophorum subsp. funduliforme]